MKEKLKKFFNKDSLFILICTLLIGFIVLFSVLFYKKDIDNYNYNNSSITLIEDSNNLNKSWLINEDGNLVGSNLLNPSTISNGKFLATSTGLLWDSGGDWFTSDFILIPRGNELYIKNFNALCLYDSNKDFIDGSGLNYDDYTSTHNYHLSVSNNVRYIRITALNTVQTMVSYTNIPYEPFGLWYSENNYNNYGQQEYTRGYNDGYNVGYSDYVSLSSNDNVLLNYQLAEYEFNSNEYHSDNLTTEYSSVYNITFLNLFDSSFSASFYPNDFEIMTNYIDVDNYLLFLLISDNIRTLEINFLSGSNIVYSLDFDFTRGDSLNIPLLIDSSFSFNSLVIKTFDTLPPSTSFIKIGLSSSQSARDYYLGYLSGKKESSDSISSLNNEISSLNSQVDTLQYQLDVANENAQNQLNGLTYTMISAVMSTPFNILHDMLNFNFFGINVFSLFTSLITLLLLIWVIKFLIGRK